MKVKRSDRDLHRSLSEVPPGGVVDYENVSGLMVRLNPDSEATLNDGRIADLIWFVDTEGVILSLVDDICIYYPNATLEY